MATCSRPRRATLRTTRRSFPARACVRLRAARRAGPTRRMRRRSRRTPSPAIAILPDGSPMPLGTPGGDVQAQAVLQVFLNMAVFDMNPQQAVEAPRFASYSFPDSFEPHSYSPAVLHVESRVPKSVRDGLA